MLRRGAVRCHDGDLVRSQPYERQDRTVIIGVSLHSAISGVPAALLEGAVVLLPRAGSFPRLRRVRSPAWAALLPGSILVGTFGMLQVPSMALMIVVLAAVTTPVLALIGVVSVARSRLLVIPAAAAAGGMAVLAAGPSARLGASVITALACVTVGTALQRLIPGRWLLAGVVAMSAMDVTLLAAGFGYHQTALLAAASNSFAGPRFTGARVGGTTIGYPDLFLAGLLGAALSGGTDQRRAAVLLTVLAIGLGSFLVPGLLLPAIVPIALALLIVSSGRALRRARRHRQGATTIVACQGKSPPTCRCWSASERPPERTCSTSGAAVERWSGSSPRAARGWSGSRSPSPSWRPRWPTTTEAERSTGSGVRRPCR